MYAQTTSEQRALLEKELEQLEKEIQQQEGLLSNQKKQTGTINGDLKKISDQITKKRADIAAKQKLISNLSSQIGVKASVIQKLTTELSREKASLARLVRMMNQTEDASLSEFLLTTKTVSQFFESFSNSTFVQDELHGSLRRTRTSHERTVGEKSLLENKKAQEAKVRAKLEEDRKKAQEDQTKKNTELVTSKKEEGKISAEIETRKKEVAKIKARLFSLVEVKGGGIAFGEAVRLAKEAGALTGVRPAFILGILQQETGIGKNVGRCFMTDPATGDGTTIAGKVISKVMKPTRDVEPFLSITKRLGKNFASTPISCPIPGIGYGGAMGPSQFIPSTWEMMEPKLERKLGVSAANPWVPLHAFTATALYVADLGASAKTEEAEKNAACNTILGVHVMQDLEHHMETVS